PVELLVEPVAPAAHRLSQDHTGDDRISEGAEFDPVAAAEEPDRRRSGGYGTDDAQAALPDPEDAQQVPALAEVAVRRADHVVDAGTDDADQHRPQHRGEHVVAAAAAGSPQPGGHDHGEHDPQH